VAAKDLLGKYLVRRVGGKTKAYRIVETEAYLGPEDKASHARHGLTKRNAPMHGPGGHWYVYFTYGMHYMLNIVTGPAGKPSAVLIRAVEPPQQDYSIILQNYRIKNGRIDGPGRVTKALKIDKRLNGKPATKASGLWIEDRGEKVNPRKIKKTARIGVAYAGEWAKKPLRFILEP
jgi:DNA-3-methyladenine glycosylase